MASDKEKEPPAPSDLTQGPIPQHFRTMAVPMAVGMLFSTLYNVVDTFYAGLISTDAQAGLAIASLVFFFLIALGFGLSTAMGALVGNALGESKEVEARRITQQGVVWGLILSIMLTLLGLILAPELIGLISEEGAYRSAANGYLQFVLVGTVFFLLAYAGNGALQARGDTRSMQRAQVAAFFCNLILNPLFIFGIPGVISGIGFNGLALSTLVSQAGVMTYVIYRLFKSGAFKQCALASFSPSVSSLKAILDQAIPSSFSMMVMMIAGFVVQYFLKGFGSEAVAGYGIALRIEQLLLLPVFGLTGSLMPIAAQNYGAKKYDRVREAAFFCFKFGCGMMLVAGVMLWIFGSLAMALFTRDPEVIRVGVSYLRIDGLILWAYMMLFAINSLFQAFKKPIWTLVIGLYRQGIGIAFFGYLYVVVIGMNVWGVWIGIATSVLTGLLLSAVLIQIISSDLIGGLWSSRSLKEAQQK